MATTDGPFGGRPNTARQLVTMAGTLVLVLVIINVVALYGLDRIRREATAHAATTDRLIAATDLAREAQVAFKIQVQEWKNVLLRGHDPADLARYRGAFETRQAAVRDRLQQLKAQVGPLGMPADGIDRLLAMHADLATRYAAALKSLAPSAPDAAWAADRSVRGMDRPLDDAFDALVADVRALADSNREAAEAAMTAATDSQRQILIAAHGAGIVLVLISLVMALRASRRR